MCTRVLLFQLSASSGGFQSAGLILVIRLADYARARQRHVLKLYPLCFGAANPVSLLDAGSAFISRCESYQPWLIFPLPRARARTDVISRSEGGGRISRGRTDSYIRSVVLITHLSSGTLSVVCIAMPAYFSAAWHFDCGPLTSASGGRFRPLPPPPLSPPSAPALRAPSSRNLLVADNRAAISPTRELLRRDAVHPLSLV